MRFLDVVDVVTNDGHWVSEGDSRSCSLTASVGDVCDLDTATEVLNGQGDGDTYRISPFGIDLSFARRVSCSRDDDDTWVEQQLVDATDLAVLRAFTTVNPYEAVTDPGDYMGVGLWRSDVQQLAASGTTAEAFLQLRNTWLEQNVSSPASPPIFFIPPLYLGALYDARLIQFSGDGADKKIFTIWGEPVVSLQDSSDLHGSMAVSGPITVYLSSVSTEKAYETRGNLIYRKANRLAMIDVAPCSIILATTTRG